MRCSHSWKLYSTFLTFSQAFFIMFTPIFEHHQNIHQSKMKINFILTLNMRNLFEVLLQFFFVSSAFLNWNSCPTKTECLLRGLCKTFSNLILIEIFLFCLLNGTNNPQTTLFWCRYLSHKPYNRMILPDLHSAFLFCLRQKIDVIHWIRNFPILDLRNFSRKKIGLKLSRFPRPKDINPWKYTYELSLKMKI